MRGGRQGWVFCIPWTFCLYVEVFPSGRGGCFSVSLSLGKGSKLSRVEQRADLEIDNGSV